MRSGKWSLFLQELRALVGPHHGMRADYLKHLVRVDFRGVATDMAEFAMVYGSRINLFLTALRHNIAGFFSFSPPIGSSSNVTKITIADSNRMYLREFHVGSQTIRAIDGNNSNISVPSLNLNAVLHRHRRRSTVFRWFKFMTGRSKVLASSGKLSRWMIVQHLMRLPTDTDHAMTAAADDSAKGKRRRRSDRDTTSATTPSLPSVSIYTEEIETDVVVFGKPVLSIPLLFLKEDFATGRQNRHFFNGSNRRIVYDLAVVVQLEEVFPHTSDAISGPRTHFLTEGRALLSSKTTDRGADVVISDLSDENEVLNALTRPRTPESFQGLRLNRRQDHRFISDYFQDGLMGNKENSSEGLPAAVLTEITLKMEFISYRLSRGSKLRLTLNSEDHINFPWRSVKERFDNYYANHSTTTTVESTAAETAEPHSNGRFSRPPQLKQLDTWRIPVLDNDELLDQQVSTPMPLRGTMMLQLPLLPVSK